MKKGLLFAILMAITCFRTLAQSSGSHQTGDTIWCVASQENDLTTLLAEEGFSLVRGGNIQTVLFLAPQGAPVLLLGENPTEINRLTAEDLAIIEQKELRVFADYTLLPGQQRDLREVNWERVVVTEKIGTLNPMDLLSINKARFLATEPVCPSLVIARVAGFDDAVFGLKETPTHPLLDHPRKNLYVSTAYLSDFSRLRLMPENRWQAFWEAILSDLIQEKVHFKSWPTLVSPSYGQAEQLPDSAKLFAVQKGINWFWGGNFLVHSSWKSEYLEKYQNLDPPVGPELPVNVLDGDGSLGILEGHNSAIDADGRQTYRYSLRTDVHGETAMALTLAGKLLGKEQYTQVAHRLIDYALKEATSGPRSDPSNAAYGLISWGFPDDYRRGVYYGDDNARFLLGSLLSAHLMNERSWDLKLRAAIDANFETTGLDGFRGGRIDDGDLQKNGRDFYGKRNYINPHPHYESWLWAVYLWFYSKTGEKKYYDLCKKGISLTMAAYPHEWRWTNGIQQERARMLLPLAWLYRISPTEEHRAWLDRIIADLKANQVECGAIREELGDPSKGDFGGPRNNAEYGIGEAPLIARNGDPVADMLYTSNFAFFGLNEAARATGDANIKQMAEKLADFLVRIQASSQKSPGIDGAWYRAFNYRDWNWWASNADAGWGSLCTLTGWIQGWIVSTLAMMEMNTSYWELTHDNALSQRDGIYQIGTAKELSAFSELVSYGENSANAELTADIDLRETDCSKVMIGSSSAPYSGVFDGKGHSITYNYQVTSDYSGLFSYVNGATIRNLTINGEATVPYVHFGGLIGWAKGNVLVENVMANVDIRGVRKGATGDAGMIGYNSGNVTFNNCATLGIMGYPSSNFYSSFVGWAPKNASTTLNSCYTVLDMADGTEFVDCSTFVNATGRPSLNNCFYLNGIGKSQGVKMTAEQFASGEVCYKLNGDQTNIQWYQKLGEDMFPVLDKSRGIVESKEDGTYANAIGLNILETEYKQRMRNIYDLNGRSIKNIHRGINIVNGKKVLKME